MYFMIDQNDSLDILEQELRTLSDDSSLDDARGFIIYSLLALSCYDGFKKMINSHRELKIIPSTIESLHFMNKNLIPAILEDKDVVEKTTNIDSSTNTIRIELHKKYEFLKGFIINKDESIKQQCISHYKTILLAYIVGRNIFDKKMEEAQKWSPTGVKSKSNTKE